MVRRTMCAAAIAAAMAFGGQALAQDEDRAGAAGATGAQAAGARQAGQSDADMTPDKFFIKHAIINDMCEQQLAQLAQQKSQSPEVKQIAQKIMQDHAKGMQQAKQVAQQLGVDVPQQLPAEKQEMLQVFQNLSGQEFDQHYLSHQKAAHAKDVMKYRDVAKMAKNEQVKQYAQEQLPMLQQHFQQVMAAAGEQMPSDHRAQPAGSRMGADDNAPARSGGAAGGARGDGSSGSSQVPGNEPGPNAGQSRTGTARENRGPTERQ
jgi:putative membrane protein